MTAREQCPDNPRSGANGAAEAHVRDCGTCRAALLAAAAFDFETTVLPGDDQILARLVDGAIRDATREARRWGRARAAGSGVRRLAVACLVALLAIGTALAAIELLAWRHRGGQPAEDTSARAVGPAKPPPGAPPLAASPSPASPAEQMPAARGAPAPAGEGPSDLLRRARVARAAGDRSAARALYQSLLRRFPGSGPAAVARVSLGMLLLEESDLTSARAALAAFEGYLVVTPAGELREEALVGRARAFARLGDAEAERAAWQSLLGAYPDTVHAPIARRRAGARAQPIAPDVDAP